MTRSPSHFLFPKTSNSQAFSCTLKFRSHGQDDDFPAHPNEIVTTRSLKRAFEQDGMTRANAEARRDGISLGLGCLGGEVLGRIVGEGWEYCGLMESGFRWDLDGSLNGI